MGPNQRRCDMRHKFADFLLESIQKKRGGGHAESAFCDVGVSYLLWLPTWTMSYWNAGHLSDSKSTVVMDAGEGEGREGGRGAEGRWPPLGSVKSLSSAP